MLGFDLYSLSNNFDILEVYETVKFAHNSPLRFINDMEALAADGEITTTMTTEEVVNVIKAHKAVQS